MAAPIAAKTPDSHPPGLYLLFFTELWERFSYYGMRGILTLFLTKAVIAGGLGMDSDSAVLLYGYSTGFVYFTPIIGGWLADNFIGQRRAILIGGILMMFGQFSLASGLSGELSVYAGLFLIIIGNGFFKPNISALVGKLYPQGDPRRDSAFTKFYQGINLGAFFAPLVCGYFAEDLFAVKQIVDGKEEIISYGFRYGFLSAGIGMLLGQIIFNALAPKYLGDVGTIPDAKARAAEGGNINEDRKLTKEESDRVTVIFIVVLFVTFFWAGFEQAGSSLTLYTDSFIDRRLPFTDWVIPTSWFQSVNPLFIVLLAPFMSSLWLRKAKAGNDWSIPAKMGMGMVLLGIGYFFMLGAVMERGGDLPDATIKANLSWLILTYLFHTVGELCLSPIGLSMITRLAPIQYASVLMGVWFLSPSVAQILGGYIAAYVKELGALTVFGSIAFFVILAGMVMFLIGRKLVYMMHGRG